ncbi:hypothetical protein HZS_7666 [Henneguya salminicola]|nr:hypothetical protein HZS_7666 [Henneguya salminicola]
MNPQIMMLFYILFYLSKTDNVFDSSIKNMGIRVVSDVFGYSSFRNTGMDQKCCGQELEKICTPCQYIMYLIQIINDFEIREFEVGYFNRPSQKLNQKIHSKILISRVKMVSLNKIVILLLLLLKNVISNLSSLREGLLTS